MQGVQLSCPLLIFIFLNYLNNRFHYRHSIRPECYRIGVKETMKPKRTGRRLRILGVTPDPRTN